MSNTAIMTLLALLKMLLTSITNAIKLIIIALILISISACGVKGPILQDLVMATKDAKS